VVNGLVTGVESDTQIEPGQVWAVYGESGKLLRRIRILAKHPFNDCWIYERIGAYHGELGRIPEFNLRYVFRLERT
jgi:hypothetical protein